MFSPQDAINYRHSGAAVTLTTGTASAPVTTGFTAVDLSDCESAVGILQFGAIAASATLTSLKVQVSDDNTTYTDLLDVYAPPTGQTAISVADTDDNKAVIVALDLRNKARWYVRWVATANTSNTHVVNVAGFIGMNNKAVAPTASNSSRIGGVITNFT